MQTSRPSRVLTSRRAGVTLGFGLGGFIDGIVLHQILEWHNMGSSVLPPTTMEALRQNMIWDGLFHAAVWVITLVGVYLLLATGRGIPLPTARVFSGQLLLGWGAFNLVEGIIDHHILGLHHVRDFPVHIPAYDWTFLVVGGIGFIAAGWAMSRESFARDAPRA